MMIDCSGLQRLLALLLFLLVLLPLLLLLLPLLLPPPLLLLLLPRWTSRTRFSKHCTRNIRQIAIRRKKVFSKTYGTRPRDVTASSREGGVMAEEAPPARGVVGTGLHCFLYDICAE